MRHAALFLLTALLAMAFQGSWRDDREVAADLRQNGASRQGAHIEVFIEAGALTDAAMDEFAAQLEQGVVNIAKYAEVPMPPAERKITYFVSGKIDISRSRGRSIYLPLERVRTKTAPYLHETVHSLVPCRDCPLWLSEGYASYVQSYVSEHMGGYDGQIFTRNGNAGVDRDARRWLSNDRGQAMFPYVGTSLDEPDLSDRRSAAAPFYIFAQSFVKYLVEKTGIKDPGTLGARQDLETLRTNWASALKT